jgi:hypothetical protein
MSRAVFNSSALPRLEVQAQACLDIAPLVGAEVTCFALLKLACTGLFVGASRFVALGAGIAFELAENRCAIAFKFSGNAGQADILAPERVDLESFFLAQVYVGHGASLRLTGLKELILFAFGPTGY